ncbi:MAG: FAD-binding oxidoreductase, partial [Candidatus Thorarchaeota archaeon]
MTEEKTEVEAPVYEDPVMRELAEVVGPERVSDMELERIVYSGDPAALPHFHYRWKYKYLVDYVVRVKTTEEIQGVVQIAATHKIPVIPRGGASSCVGSSSPSRGGISLDIKRMDNILEINSQEMFARVEPGVTFEELEIELGKSGFTFGLYPSSAKSAVLGGWVGCGGAAGIGTPHYGVLPENLLELTVVKPTGEAVKVSGDDLYLFNASYGILGVISEIKIKMRK